MDVKTAVALAHTPLHLLGISDTALAARANAHAKAHAGGLEPVAVLDALHPVRAVDALLALGEATAVRVHADLYEAYKHWSTLRYLGVFDDDGAGALCLSQQGRQIGGNQRRVMSEELGIAVGALMAREWASRAWGGHGAVRVVDIDETLTAGKLVGNGWRKTVKQSGAHRPDYLVLADPTVGSGPRVRLLECKGTKSAPHSVAQLAHAGHQLRGVRVAGRIPMGLAVSFLGNSGGVDFRALQTPVTFGDPSGSQVAEVELTALDLTKDVNVARLPDFFVDDEREPLVVDDEMLSTAVRASLANLSSFAGNAESFDRWAPETLRVKARVPLEPLERQEVVIGGGTRVRGIASTTSLPGGDLQVFFGVDAEVDDALSRGVIEDVLAVQASVSERLVAARGDDGSDQATAMSSEGAVLRLRLV